MLQSPGAISLYSHTTALGLGKKCAGYAGKLKTIRGASLIIIIVSNATVARCKQPVLTHHRSRLRVEMCRIRRQTENYKGGFIIIGKLKTIFNSGC